MIEQAAIATRGARDLALLTQINIGFGSREIVRAARLDLNEAQSRAVVSDNIYLSFDFRPAPRAPDGRAGRALAVV